MKSLRMISALLACLMLLSLSACAPRATTAEGDSVIDVAGPDETAGAADATPTGSPSSTLDPLILGTPSGANPTVPMPTETPEGTVPEQTPSDTPAQNTQAPVETKAPAETEAPAETPAASATPAPSSGDDLPYYLYVEKGSFTLTIYEKGADGTYSEVYKTYRIAHGGNKTPAGTFTLSGDRERWHEFPDGGFVQFATRYYLHDWKFRLYLDHYFEDESQMFWQYGRWKDGQLGFDITLPSNRWVSRILWEGISTKDQTGPVLYDGFAGSFGDLQMSGADSYFNHSIYQAWQYYGNGIGSPLLPGPAYNVDHSIIFRSNRMKAHHIGLQGSPASEWSWRLLTSFTRHWGTYTSPFSEVKHQFSGMAEVRFSPLCLSHWSFKAAFAMDRGDYIGNSAGGMLTVEYRIGD